jgi:hypothetical protein
MYHSSFELLTINVVKHSGYYLVSYQDLHGTYLKNLKI